jgi:hypothetical protein
MFPRFFVFLSVGWPDPTALSYKETTSVIKLSKSIISILAEIPCCCSDDVASKPSLILRDGFSFSNSLKSVSISTRCSQGFLFFSLWAGLIPQRYHVKRQLLLFFPGIERRLQLIMLLIVE